MSITVIHHIGHFRNDTFGPFFDNRAMEYEKMVHLYYFKKEIGSLDSFVHFWWHSRFFPQNHDTSVNIVLDPKISGGHKIGLIGARDLTIFLK